MICEEFTETAMQICPSEPAYICQPVRPSSKRTVPNSREIDELQRERESDIKDIIIAVLNRQSTRTDPVPVPKAPEVLDDPKADSDRPAEPEIADEAKPPLRRSSRTTAGKHGNLHKEPRSTVSTNSLVAFHLVNLILRTLKTYKQY